MNAHSGSVLVHYDHRASSMDDVLGCLRDVGLIVGSIAEADGDELPDLGDGGDGGHSTTVAGVVETLDDLDRRLSKLTGRRVDLKLVFPAALGGIGLSSALRNGIGFAEVPAYILIWYAFDTFWKFHSAHQRPAAAGPTSRGNDRPSAHVSDGHPG